MKNILLSVFWIAGSALALDITTEFWDTSAYVPAEPVATSGSDGAMTTAFDSVLTDTAESDWLASLLRDAPGFLMLFR